MKLYELRKDSPCILGALLQSYFHINFYGDLKKSTKHSQRDWLCVALMFFSELREFKLPCPRVTVTLT